MAETRARKAAAKSAENKTPARRRPARAAVAKPQPATTTTTPEEVRPAVSDNTTTPDVAEAPKKGRRPNPVGQAAATFEKARKRLDRARAKAAKVQAVNDELAAAEAAFTEAEKNYRDVFTASLETPAS